MKPGTWPHIGYLYLCGLGAAASLGVLGPIAGDLSRQFAVSPQDIGLAIGGQLLPLAVAGFGIGWLVDRLGTAVMFRVSLLVLLLTALANHVLPDFAGLRLSLLLQGAGFVAMIMTGQVILMLCCSGKRLVQGMALWATAAPMGYGVGLLLVSGFAGTPAWRQVFLLHAGLVALLLLASWAMPGVQARVSSLPTADAPPAGPVGALRNGGVLRLGAAMALMNLVGLGANAILPLYLGQSLGLAPVVGARLLALASLASVAGSLVIGSLLNRGWAPMRTVVMMSAVAIFGALATFLPGLPLASVALGLFALQFTSGGGLALCFAVLPRLLRHPGESGVAAGLSAQVGGIGAALSAPVFFALLGLNASLLLAACVIASWIVVLWIMPARRLRAAG